jgi:hypothetical protein
LGSNDDINFLLRGFAEAKEEGPIVLAPTNVGKGDECLALKRENQALKQVREKVNQELR